MIARLQRHGDYQLDQLIDFDHDNFNHVSPVIKEFQARKNIRQSRALELSTKILCNIIFESKTEPWWIHVNALGNYLDWLYTHSIDVAMISLMMAMKMGYSHEELWGLGLSALLHDVGMLLVPKPIWEKTEPLDEIEISYIR